MHMRCVGLAVLLAPALASSALELAEQRLMRAREELEGWYTGNATLQGNWTVAPDRDKRLAHAWDTIRTEPAQYAFLPNVSSILTGNWTSQGNNTAPANDTMFSWTEGTLFGRLSERPISGYSNTTRVSGILYFSGQLHDGTYDDALLDTIGVHSHADGRVYAVATPRTLPIDSRRLFSMIPNELRDATYNMSSAFIGDQLRNIRSAKHDSASAPMITDSNTCTLHVYGQVRPNGAADKKGRLARQLEELRQPSGLYLGPAPHVDIDSVAYSPECSLVVALEGHGKSPNAFWDGLRVYALVMLISTARHVFLTADLFDKSQVQVAQLRTSLFFSYFSSVLNMMIAVIHCSFALMTRGSLRMGLLGLVFIQAISMFVFESRMSSQVYMTHMAALDSQPQQAAPANAAAVATENTAEGAAGGQQAPQLRPTTLLGRLRMQRRPTLRELLAFVPLSLVIAALFGIPLFFNLIILCALSFWVVQIVHNTWRDTVSCLSIEFIVHTTVLRCVAIGCASVLTRSSFARLYRREFIRHQHDLDRKRVDHSAGGGAHWAACRRSALLCARLLQP